MIIKSKLKIPKRDENMIYVPKLDRLFEDTDAACIAVKAVSGFGKTTVLAELAGRRRRFVRWYTLDETDNDGERFLECLEKIWQTVDRKAASLFGEDFGERIQALACRAQDWHCGRIYIVMDNFQVISSKEVLQMLFLLQQYAQDKAAFVFLTNADVPEGFLKQLLRGNGMLLSEDDLRFTPDEAVQYFGDSLGCAGDVLRQITKGLCGWPLGVQGIIGYLREKERSGCTLSFPVGTETSPAADGFWNKMLQESFLSSYLDETLWEKCTAEMRLFLKQTAMLDEFSWEMCRTVLSGGITRRTFEKVISGCGFWYRVEGRTDTYRYCQAFRAYLRRMVSVAEEKRETETGKVFVETGMDGKLFQVRTFGTFRVTALKDGKELTWRTRKGRELFAYLLDIEGKAVEREKLIEVLWQDEIPLRAVAMLHNMIYNIRKELAAHGLGTILIYEDKRYRLGIEGADCDFYHINKIVKMIEERDTTALRAEYRSFLNYWGRYLEDIDGCWAEAKREYYDEMYKKGCFFLAEQFTRENNGETAIKLYQNILLVEPYSEKAVEKMLLLYGEQREWEKARQCYSRFCETLERDLGIAPAKEVFEAYHRYLQGSIPP